MISISKGVFTALIGGLVLALMAVAYLLGRESVHVAPAVVVTVTPTAVAAAPPPTSPSGVPPPPASPQVVAEPPPTRVVTRPAVAAKPRPAAPQAPRRLLAVDASQREAVRRYFAAMDQIGPGKLADDTQNFANELLNSAMSGDFSKFDRLITETEGSQSKVKAVVPPPPCKKHHAESLAIVGQSLHMLRFVRNSIAHNDVGGLTSLPDQANALKARAELLQQLEESLKAGYGIAQASPQ